METRNRDDGKRAEVKANQIVREVRGGKGPTMITSQVTTTITVASRL